MAFAQPGTGDRNPHFRAPGLSGPVISIQPGKILRSKEFSTNRICQMVFGTRPGKDLLP